MIRKDLSPSWASGNSIKAYLNIHSVRSPSDFDTLVLLSASNRTTLITLWTASWCPSCRIVAPLIRQLIEEEGAGEERGGVGYAYVYSELSFIQP